MPVFKDQTRRTTFIDADPKRIVSLVPSQTELLADLGLITEVVGITKFCVHPAEWFCNKTKVGGTKQLNIEAILKLQPDLIIANKEENVKEQVEELAKDIPVWISDVSKLEEAYEMISMIGEIVGKKVEAEYINSLINNQFSQLTFSRAPFSTVYLIWQQPYMTIGGDTFIHSMIELAGFKNCFKEDKRYPKITMEDIIAKEPELLLLSSEPFPFKQKHIDELQFHFPNTKILLVDGEMFSWYGSRLLKSPSYFKTLHNLIK